MHFSIVCLGISSGAGGYNLNVSFMTAFRYGRLGISSSSTLPLLPTKFRISACTLRITLGTLIKAVMVQTVDAALVSVAAINMS